MSGTPSVIDALFSSIELITADQCEITDPARVQHRMRLVQALVARLPHKYLLAATKEQIQTAGRIMMAEGRTREEMRALQTTLVALLDRIYQVGALSRHPLRPNEIRRSTDTRVPEAALVVGLPGKWVQEIRRLLQPQGVAIHAVQSEDAAFESTAWFPFSFILTRIPPHGPAEFFANLRRKSSLCRSAGVILVVAEEKLSKARIFEGRGANRVLTFSVLADALPATVSALGMVSERKQIKLAVRIDVDGARRTEDGHTENVSRSGLLLRTKAKLEVGNDIDLEFTLPGDNEPIHVSAEIVRRTTFGREDFEGLGVRFLSFVGEGQDKIDDFLRQDF